MNLNQWLILGIIAFATLVAWNLWRGQTGILKLYLLSLLVLAALVLAAVAQTLDAPGLTETANSVAIFFSLAGCTTRPGLWQQEIGADLRETHIYDPLRPGDLVSWRGWLKAVDRCGAAWAALAYLLAYAIALLAVGLTIRPPGPASDRGAFLLALAPIALFALLSSWYIYRGARRLVPGA